MLGLWLQRQSLQWAFRTDFLWDWLVWSPCGPGDSQESSPTPQFGDIDSSVLSCLCGPALASVYDCWRGHGFDWVNLCWQSNVNAPICFVLFFFNFRYMRRWVKENLPVIYVWVFCLCFPLRVSLVVQSVKSLPAMQETRVQSLGWEDPQERKWQPTPVFLPGEFHEQRSLAGYSSWGVTKVGHNLATKPPPRNYYQQLLITSKRNHQNCMLSISDVSIQYHLWSRVLENQIWIESNL